MSAAHSIYSDVKARIEERYGPDVNRQPSIGSYVRDLTGAVGQVLTRATDWTYVTVQFRPFGKRRHKHRQRCDIRGLAAITEMEVLAEASR